MIIFYQKNPLGFANTLPPDNCGKPMIWYKPETHSLTSPHLEVDSTESITILHSGLNSDGVDGPVKMCTENFPSMG